MSACRSPYDVWIMQVMEPNRTILFIVSRCLSMIDESYRTCLVIKKKCGQLLYNNVVLGDTEQHVCPQKSTDFYIGGLLPPTSLTNHPLAPLSLPTNGNDQGLLHEVELGLKIKPFQCPFPVK